MTLLVLSRLHVSHRCISFFMRKIRKSGWTQSQTYNSYGSRDGSSVKSRIIKKLINTLLRWTSYQRWERGCIKNVLHACVHHDCLCYGRCIEEIHFKGYRTSLDVEVLVSDMNARLELYVTEVNQFFAIQVCLEGSWYWSRRKLTILPIPFMLFAPSRNSTSVKCQSIRNMAKKVKSKTVSNSLDPTSSTGSTPPSTSNLNSKVPGDSAQDSSSSSGSTAALLDSISNIEEATHVDTELDTAAESGDYPDVTVNKWSLHELKTASDDAVKQVRLDSDTSFSTP